MGELSEKAWAAPGNAFSLPGPCCMANTPMRLPLVMRLNPSAIAIPTRSWRHMIGRMPAFAAASTIGWAGYTARNSVPSRLRISAIASAPCMCV